MSQKYMSITSRDTDLVADTCMHSTYMIQMYIVHCTYHETLQMYTFIFTLRELSAPPRKSRRISKRKEVIQETQNSDTHTNVIGNTENRATAQMIKAQIEAVIPDITNSVIAALSAHGLLFPGNNMANVTQTNTENNVACTPSGLNSNALSTSVRNAENSNETSQSVNISNNNNASTDTSSFENSTTSMTQQYSQPSFRKSLFPFIVTPNCTQAGTSQQTSGLFGAPNQTDTRITSGNTSQQSVTQGTLHDSVAGTPFTNSSTSPYNFTRQSISKPLAL